MKYKTLLLFASMVALLAFSQSVAIAMINNPSSNVRVSAILDDQDFSVDIYFVGTTSSNTDEITPSSSGTYDIVSTAPVTNLVIKLNISGYTLLTEGNNITVGQLILVMDGTAYVVGSGYTALLGTNIAVDQGTHVITFLYIGKGNDGMHYASDTIIVRISPEDNFSPLEKVEVPLDYQVTDVAVKGANWTGPAPAYFDWGWLDFYRNASYTVPNDVSLKGAYTYENGTVMDEIDLKDESVFNFTASNAKLIMTGTVDTSGIDTYSVDTGISLPGLMNYADENHTTTVGYQFIIDGNGLTYVGDSAPTTVTIYKSSNSSYIYSFTGVLAVADYGWFWGSSHAILDPLGYGDYAVPDVADLDGFVASTSGDVVYQYSFDMIASASGAYLTSNPFYGTEAYGLTTEKAPGMSAINTLIGLFSVAFVAFVIPRYRKRN